jgi:glucan 1,3-beta-glucosidase
MMLFFQAAILTASATAAICAHFKIPEVERTVNHIVQEFSNTLHSSGNQANGFYVQERDAATYWYESIAHQGISAFGPSGYKVFRNVKDYGAKGVVYLHG